MEHGGLFNILGSVDSTNNYAMAKVHEGMARHGMAWYAHDQTAGKGQRGKQWQSQPGSNIILSIALQPGPVFTSNSFYFIALAAVSCIEFLQKISKEKFYIKWPNDLYWRDRKTGGILIENNFSGTNWNWAVLGIGINVNQKEFATGLQQATSLAQITGNENLNPLELAQQLSAYIIQKFNTAEQTGFNLLLQQYNDLLYKKEETVRLKKENAVFSTCIKGVNKFGQLLTEDSMQRSFNFGEVEWIHEPI